MTAVTVTSDEEPLGVGPPPPDPGDPDPPGADPLPGEAAEPPTPSLVVPPVEGPVKNPPLTTTPTPGLVALRSPPPACGGVTGTTTDGGFCGGVRGGPGPVGGDVDRRDDSLGVRHSGSSPVGGTSDGAVSVGPYVTWGLTTGGGRAGACEARSRSCEGAPSGSGPRAGRRNATSTRTSAHNPRTPARSILRRNVPVPPFRGTSQQRQTTQELLGHQLNRDGAARVILPGRGTEIRRHRQVER